MAISILRDLPFFDHETKAGSPTGEVVVRPYQIVLWVSITRQFATALDAGTPRFPVILDIGNNHNFALRQEHLVSWAGAAMPDHFVRQRVNIAGQQLPLISANVWLHRNQAGERDAFSRRPAVCLELPEGIAVYPPHVPNAIRLPTLGLRALARNGLRLVIDGKKLRVSLQKSR
jgi:hypothetical protein